MKHVYIHKTHFYNYIQDISEIFPFISNATLKNRSEL